MDHAGRAVFRHGMPRVRDWAIWSLPRPLLALWSVVTCGYLAWIGERAIILPGRRVGRGAIVGAGSVVTRDVEPFSIVGGNPARPIGRREPGSTGRLPPAVTD